ncbi:MAG TPA: MAPEG family protein [Candidatus Binatia bacterium]|nr:MAPEG family protein [Candidatus Binatia bacterium]
MPTLDDPVIRLYVVVYVLLALKMAALGSYTSILRLGRKVYATPEDYRFQGLAPRPTVDEDVERVRRAHQNDLENILPFFVLGVLFLLTRPSWNAAAIYLIGFLVARTLHSIFYVQGLQPHRTIAFTLGGVLTLVMAVQTLVTALRSG